MNFRSYFKFTSTFLQSVARIIPSYWFLNKSSFDEAVGHVEPRTLNWHVFEAQYFSWGLSVCIILHDIASSGLLSVNGPALWIEFSCKVFCHFFSPGALWNEQKPAVRCCLNSHSKKMGFGDIAHVHHAHSNPIICLTKGHGVSHNLATGKVFRLVSWPENKRWVHSHDFKALCLRQGSLEIPSSTFGQRLWAVVCRAIRIVFARVRPKTLIESVVSRPIGRHYWTDSGDRRCDHETTHVVCLARI